MKKLFLIFFVSFFLLVGFSFSAEKTPLQQEKDKIEHLGLKIDKYVKSVSWNEPRIYQEEVNQIGKIIEGFGYKYEDYGVGVFGGPITKLPMFIDVVIKGNAKPQWKLRWTFQNNMMMEQMLQQMLRNPPSENPKPKPKQIPKPNNSRKYNAESKRWLIKMTTI